MAARNGAVVSSSGPAWSVINGDCLDAMKRMHERGILADLIFADPPFNIGQEYSGHDDRMNPVEFLKFLGCRIGWMIDCLAPDGTLCVHVPDDLVFAVESAVVSRGLTRAEWIVWHYRFGQWSNSGLINSKAHCLVYCRDAARRTWNPEAILVESDRVKYGDARTQRARTPGRRVPLDVWGVNETFASDYGGDGPYWGRVSGAGSNKERCPGHPNQLPIRYLQRIVRGFSNHGDLVIDPFTGSGTTGLVCRHESRRFIGVEICPEATASARKRIENGYYRP